MKCLYQKNLGKNHTTKPRTQEIYRKEIQFLSELWESVQVGGRKILDKTHG